MRTFKVSKSVQRELQNGTVYAVRNPNRLFRYFGKDNCAPVKRESAFLQQLKQHSTLVPVLYYVQGAHVIDGLAAMFIDGLVACFEGNTLFLYDLDTNAYVSEVIEAESRWYIVMQKLTSGVAAVEIQRNNYTKAQLLKMLRQLNRVSIETETVQNYTVLGHFLQQKHFR